jgi:hypothetical protein
MTVLRAIGLALAAALVSIALWQIAAPPLRRLQALADLETQPFGQLVTTLAAAALLACWGWFVLASAPLLLRVVVATVGTSDGVPSEGWSGGLAERACPRLTRWLLLAALGVSAAATTAVPAAANPVGGTGSHSAGPSPVLTGLALPDRLPTAHRARPPVTIVVRSGDCLWTIAEQLLPGSAADAAISAAWHRIDRANRTRIGPDPDLILPGTRLRVPNLHRDPREERR